MSSRSARTSSLPVSGRRRASSPRLRHLLTLLQGAALVIGVYAFIGGAIGLAAGSLSIGVGAGAIAGLGAVAAILLIRGSAIATDDRSEPADRTVVRVR